MEFLAANGRPHPGFRFHPTDEELFVHYLREKALGMPLEPEFIAEIDIYQFHPEDLRERAYFKKELIWYFFCARKRKYCRGDRQIRATDSGFWKPTGEGKTVLYREQIVGKIQTLVFYQGKAKKGVRTNWVMHEYKLEPNAFDNTAVSHDEYVLCKIFKKSGAGPKNGEQYGAPYIIEEWDNARVTPVAVQHQCTSVLANCVLISGSESVDAHRLHTSEQVNPSIVSLSAVDQAPSPSGNVASSSMAAVSVPLSSADQDPTQSANVASCPMGAGPDYNHAVDQLHIPISEAADTVTMQSGFHAHAVDQVHIPSWEGADIASMLNGFHAHAVDQVHIPISEAADIASMRSGFHADDIGIYDGLGDLGIRLADLDGPLYPWS